MSKTVEFYYDYGSPTAYLAWTQLPSICDEAGAELVHMPVLLGGIFKAVDSTTPVAVKPKGAWMFDDISRYAKRYGVPFAMNPHFIFTTLAVMRGAVWAKKTGVTDAYTEAMFKASWEQGRDVNDPAQIADIVSGAGLDADAMAGAIQDPEIKQGLIDATTEAVERGLFGAPTMFVDGEMHFGQDRLDWVREALNRP